MHRLIFFTLILMAITMTNISCSTPEKSSKDTTQPTVATTGEESDPYLWLEEIESNKSLEWVRARNDLALRELQGDKRYNQLEKDIRKIITAKDRIPGVSAKNGYLYNFWQDDQHVRGIWRRTTLEEYKKAQPKWETILDLDVLSKKENENWVWKGPSCLPPKFETCMVVLSRGGKDASVIREYNVATKSFVPGGFQLNEAKSHVAWHDENTLFVGTDLGPNTVTDSGYPRQVRLWKRGTPLSEANVIFEAEKSDVSVNGYTLFRPEGKSSWLERRISFYESQLFHLDGELTLHRLELPQDIEFQSDFKNQLVFLLRSDWNIGNETWKRGDLISIEKSAALSGKFEGHIKLIKRPDEKSSVAYVSETKDYLFIGGNRNVAALVEKAEWTGEAWKVSKIELPGLGTVSVHTADSFGDQIWFNYEDFLVPSSLYFSVNGQTPKKIKSIPERFSAKGLIVSQHETTSSDGTKVPYFVVQPFAAKSKGPRPTLLYGYGGFEVSLTPWYSGTVGKAWLEKGGVYVVANIRGGGEFGPKWHQSALKENRQKAFDDFIAIAEDLIKKGITSSKQLGIQGGSNGGLLVGASFVQRPELFNAVVCQVPLLDMLRYHKLLAGASWVAEYGSPDDKDMRPILKKYSPYQNVLKDRQYPRAFFMTSTKDDRVHPGHARKMVARLLDQGHPLLYFENIEGGHSAAANLEQKVKMQSLQFTYLYRQLMGN